MLTELLASLWVNTHSTELGSVRLTESKSISSEEAILLQNGLFMFLAILSEKASTVLDGSSFSDFGGRIRKYSSAVLLNEEGFAPFLEMLDGADDIVTNSISSNSLDFKGPELYNELHRFLSTSSSDFWRVAAPVLKRVLDGPDLAAVAFLRQLFQLLSKVGINRDDLLADYILDYRHSEDVIYAESCVQRAGGDRYWSLIHAIRNVLSPIVNGFVMDPRKVKNGPGAVSDPKVKTSLEKFQNFSFDARIDYLLRKEGHGNLSDFSPFPLLSEGDRTSRVVFVPKTWKKLRGISAEPAVLQYFQQAVFASINASLQATPFRQVISLSDQEGSGEYALKGSRDGSLATIDLSSASDSVTLQLVKDIFGNTSLCRWLLATRSTHTLIDNERLRISKFAPMGSACCFPVECLIFMGIVLATVAMKTGRLPNLSKYLVYGDDIICPSVHAPDIIESLTDLGFSVNTDKTYFSGYFRESCGVDAWHGHDVTPLKVKDFSFPFDGSRPCSYEHHSRVIAYLNSLWCRGYWKTRSFLLGKYLVVPINLGREVFHAAKALEFGDGSRGTLCSTHATNFQLERAPIKGLFRFGYKAVVWRPRQRRIPKQLEPAVDEANYFIWQLRFSSDKEETCLYDLRWFKSRDVHKSPDLSRKEVQMIPTYSVVDPWYD